MKKPDFLIIGVQRGGSSSLFRYLMEHPQIAAPVDKEIHFFELNFHRGWDWYISQFPYLKETEEKNFITGEASPYYIYHPLVPQRVKQYCPEIKLIVLLRDPLARAISHYHHCLRFQLESLPIEEAFAQEGDRLKQEEEKLKADPEYYSYNHQHLSYLSRGRYVEQLENWRAYFPAEQFLILQSEAFYANPSKTLKQVTDFLGIESYELADYYPHNKAEYPQASSSLINNLSQYFEPYNQKLYDYLKREFEVNEEINFSSYQQFWALKVEINDFQEQNIKLTQGNKELREISNNLTKDLQICQQKAQQLPTKVKLMQQLELENEQLRERIKAMESSKFWQIRKFWFKMKRKLGLKTKYLQ
jgi:hypothetical protein